MKKKLIIIIVLVVVVLGAVGYFVFVPKPEPEPEVSYYVPGDFFVTNIKDSVRLLKTTIVIELSTEDEEANQYFTENNHIIRDIIVFTLRDKTEEELRATGVQDELRSEITENLKDRMGVDYIETIYFNDYVIQ